MHGQIKHQIPQVRQMQLFVIQFTIKVFHTGFMLKTYVKYLNFKLY